MAKLHQETIVVTFSVAIKNKPFEAETPTLLDDKVLSRVNDALEKEFASSDMIVEAEILE